MSPLTLPLYSLRLIRFVLVALTVPGTCALAAPGDVTVFAGDGFVTEGNALSIGQQPRGLAVRGTLLYIADEANGLIRQVDMMAGQETVVGGWVTSSHHGDQRLPGGG